MDYTILTNSSGGKMILRNSDGAFIPLDPLNRDYQAYVQWVAQGGIPTQQTS